MVQKAPKILGASLAAKLNGETLMGVQLSLLKWLHCRKQSRQIPFFVQVDFNLRQPLTDAEDCRPTESWSDRSLP
jgi:hypothetical protein